MSSTHACEGGSEPGGSEAGVGSTARSRPRPPHCPSGSSGETHRGPKRSPEKGCLGAVCHLLQQEWAVSEACADTATCRRAC